MFHYIGALNVLEDHARVTRSREELIKSVSSFTIWGS